MPEQQRQTLHDNGDTLHWPDVRLVAPRRYELMSDYCVEWHAEGYPGQRLIVPRLFVCDGASVPALLEWYLGRENILPAAVAHDWQYAYGGRIPADSHLKQQPDGSWIEARHTWTRKESDRFFARNLRFCDISGHQRRNAYRAVRIGGYFAWRRGERRIAAQLVALLLFFLAGAMAAPAVAQDTTYAAVSEVTDSASIRWISGLSVGVPGYGEEVAASLFTIGVHGIRMRPGRPTFDYSLGTMPRALVQGALALGGRAGLAVPLVLSRSTVVVPSVGGSFIGAIAVGGEDAGGVVGSNAGIAVFMLDENSRGLRIGVSWHRFNGIGDSVWLAEIGFARGH